MDKRIAVTNIPKDKYKLVLKILENIAGSEAHEVSDERWPTLVVRCDRSNEISFSGEIINKPSMYWFDGEYLIIDAKEFFDE